MASWRLTMIGAGNKNLGAASLPVPAPFAQAFQSRGQVCGSPGTRRVPAPAPFQRTDESLAARAQSGWIGLPSSDFHYWNPGVYFSYPASRAAVSVFSDNQMPVPAIDPRGIAPTGGGLGSAVTTHAIVMPGPVMLNQWQVANPRVAPKYADRNSKKRGRRG